MAEMTIKQQRFCEEYLVDFNATQAAARAGYSEKTAYEMGSRQLRKVEIQQKISELVEALSHKTHIKIERVLKEYARIAFFNPKNLFDENGNLKSVEEMDEDTVAVITSLDIHEIMASGGSPVQVIKKLRFADKIRALDSLAKHLGMFVDKIAFTDKTGKHDALENIIAKAEEIANRIAKKHNLSGSADV